MAPDKIPGTIELRKRQTLLLPDIRGTTLRVTRGAVWITQQNDTRDVVLGAGEMWTVERDGLTIVQAQTDTVMSAAGPALHPGSPAAAGLARLWRHVCEKIEAAFAGAARRPRPYY